MTWRLFGAKPLSEPVIGYCQLDPKEQTWNFNQNIKLFIHENKSENVVCEMAAILSRGRLVNRALVPPTLSLTHLPPGQYGNMYFD